MSSKQVFSILLVACFLSLVAFQAQAGFGISPPYVRNDKLLRNSHYEQEITLVRGDPTEDLKAEISIDVPGTEDWISIDKGMEFILAKGEKQVPMKVIVDIPKDAEFGNYKGYIRIRTLPVIPPEKEGGTVAIVLGAQIDIDIDVTEKEIFDFLVRSVKVTDVDEWKETDFIMSIENTGNIKGSPSKVHLDIYDSWEKNLLASADNTNKLEKVEPFKTKEITAKIPVKVEAGSYWAKFKVLKDSEVVREGKLPLSVLPTGTLIKEVEEPAEESSNWFQNILSKFPYFYFYIGAGVILLVLVGLLIWLERKRRKMTPQEKKTIKIMDIKKKEE